ncbi:hypothetical protein JHK87_054817 [Glycine soja]|nr:hypothetical protein JHK87_054817 [Glycine soja]
MVADRATSAAYECYSRGSPTVDNLVHGASIPHEPMATKVPWVDIHDVGYTVQDLWEEDGWRLEKL